MERDFHKVVSRILEEKDDTYKEDAYHFMMEALGYTQRKLKIKRHIDTVELLDGIRELLIRKFGPLTKVVLRHWGIQSTEDFGRIVFNMIDYKMLSKRDDDNIDQFREGFDFDEVFLEGYRRDLHKKVSRMK